MALLLEDLLGLPQEVRYRPVEPGLGADAALELSPVLPHAIRSEARQLKVLGRPCLICRDAPSAPTNACRVPCSSQAEDWGEAGH